ncbi:hook-length control protein FliK [Oceanobacillus limi]|uniref:Hook-length control protein FliK n=1 Tax=Oceanobacillus limi TaxID=930131 RepID=A0A1H9Z0Z0_9BACI|nr:flagellar hook-length control protein FliK [Oceanobacillus limi]SES75164.1 hook-length control protein FliK [Oceanobacillus limi]
MNAIGMLFSKVSEQLSTVVETKQQQSTKKDDLFQSLLLKESNSSVNNLELSTEDGETIPEDIKALLDGAGDLEEALQPLVAWLMSNENVDLSNLSTEQVSLLKDVELSNDQLMNLLHNLNASISSDQTEKGKQTQFTIEQLISLQETLVANSNGKDLLSDDQIKNLNKFLDLFSKFEAILQDVNSQRDLKKAAPQILDLLQKWTALEKSLGNNSNVLNLTNQEGSKLEGIWKDLLQSFQKRNQFAANAQYNTNAKVTTTDIAKWVDHALQKNGLAEKLTGQNVNAWNGSSMPMTRLEQYVIHVNQAQGTQQTTPDQQLMDQIQKVMKSSKFLSMPNGANQLSISLRPDNLGDMMIKLTQINGEMTVKIMVTSQAAKEMLESNMNQLKNMFSPHQVTIEKQDLTTQQQGQNMQKNQDEKSFNEQNDNNSSGSSSSNDNEQSSSENDFESAIQDLLLNEEV